MSLHLDFCSAEAARFACEKWHYSKSLPPGKSVKIGVWEDGKFIGAVIFSQGANKNIARPYELKMHEVCELVRVALTKHVAPVSRIMAIALMIVKKVCPGLRLIISYADCDQNHHGGIYQATNWIYVGMTAIDKASFLIDGEKTHTRTIAARFGTNKIDVLKKRCKKVEIQKSIGKHKYLMPLDKEIAGIIAKKALPYPKRAPVVQE